MKNSLGILPVGFDIKVPEYRPRLRYGKVFMSTADPPSGAGIPMKRANEVLHLDSSQGVPIISFAQNTALCEGMVAYKDLRGEIVLLAGDSPKVVIDFKDTGEIDPSYLRRVLLGVRSDGKEPVLCESNNPFFLAAIGSSRELFSVYGKLDDAVARAKNLDDFVIIRYYKSNTPVVYFEDTAHRTRVCNEVSGDIFDRSALTQKIVAGATKHQKNAVVLAFYDHTKIDSTFLVLLIGGLRSKGIEPILNLKNTNVLVDTGVAADFVTIETNFSKAVDAAINYKPEAVES